MNLTLEHAADDGRLAAGSGKQEMEGKNVPQGTLANPHSETARRVVR
jgi:hypothetical protein